MELQLSQDMLTQIGAQDQADLVSKLKLAYEKGQSIENIEGIAQAMRENSDAITKALTTLAETKQSEVDAEAFAEAARSKALETFKSLPADDPQRVEIRKAFEAELGTHDADVLLSGDAFQKALQAPISVNSDSYEDTKAMRKAFDYLMLYCASRDGLKKSKTTPDRLVVDKQLLKHGYDLLVKQDFEGAAQLQKAIDDAMDSQTAGEGLEWVPAQILSRNLYNDIWLECKVPGNFHRYKTTGPTLTVPRQGDRSRMYGMDEATEPSDWNTIKATPHTFGTGKVDFAIRKAAILQLASKELIDDSVIPILDEIYSEIVFGAANGIEDAVINGSRALNDLDNAGADTARLWANTADAGDGIRLATGVKDARYLWNGIRKSVNAGAKLDSTSFGRDELIDLRKKLGKYGVKPDDLFLVVSPETYFEMLKFDEVKTLEVYGAQATVLQGELARLDNIPILVSPYIYTNLDDTGVFTNGTVVGGSAGVANLTHALLVNKRAYAFADRMNIMVESEYAMTAQQHAIQATMRLDFRKRSQTAHNTEANLIGLSL